MEQDIGHYFIVDVNRNAITTQNVDLETLGRELCIFQPWEELEGDPKRPRETAIIAEINGTVKYGEVTNGQRKIYVVGDDGERRQYLVPRGVRMVPTEGRVKAGESLVVAMPPFLVTRSAPRVGNRRAASHNTTY
jgi:hypothetical protein